jgi:hypothetical protein
MFLRSFAHLASFAVIVLRFIEFLLGVIFGGMLTSRDRIWGIFNVFPRTSNAKSS